MSTWLKISVIDFVKSFGKDVLLIIRYFTWNSVQRKTLAKFEYLLTELAQNFKLVCEWSVSQDGSAEKVI